MSDIIRYQKEVKTILVCVDNEETGLAEDISSCTFKFTVKSQADDDATDASAIISKTVYITSGTTGEATIPITSSDSDQTPSTYFYDLWIQKPGGTQYVIKRGKFIVKKTETNNL